MATGYRTYGPWVPSSGAAKRIRLRFEWSVATPSPGATTVPVTLIVSVEAGNWFWDGQAHYSRSGALGSRNETIRVEVRPSGGASIIDRVTTDVPIYAAGAYMISAAASLSGIDYIGSGVTASHASSIPMPGRVSGTPGAPRPVAQYVSDTEAVISWGNTDLADRYYVEQWSEAHQRWTRLGTVFGTSVRDYGLSPNNRYKWRVCSGNGSGYESPWNETGGIRTTPNAPALRVERSGSTIEVHLTSAANYPQHWYLERRLNGGAWQYWTQDDGPNGAASMTGNGGDTWEFRGRSGVSEGGQRWSRWTTTEKIVPLAPPAAPELRGPSGNVSTHEVIRYQWRHVSQDNTPQSAVEIRYRPVAAADWAQTITWTGSEQDYASRTLPQGEYVWQARTKGQHPGWGPWSDPAGFTVIPPPNVTILSPAEGEVVKGNLINTRVEAADPTPGWHVDGWRVILEQEVGGHATPAGEWRGDGDPDTIPLPHRLEDDKRYFLAVYVHSTSGLWSPFTPPRSFTVDYALPATPLLSARFVESEGAVAVRVEAQAGEADTALIRVEVSRDFGATWRPLGETRDAQAVITDPIPRLGSEVSYRAIAVSDLPSESAPAETTIATPTDRLWLNPDGATPLWVRGDLSIQVSTSQETKLEHYLGATYPTPHWGEARTDSIKVGFRTAGRGEEIGSSEASWRLLHGRRLLYRDPEGRVYRCILDGDLTVSQTRHAIAAWSMTLAVIDG